MASWFDLSADDWKDDNEQSWYDDSGIDQLTASSNQLSERGVCENTHAPPIKRGLRKRGVRNLDLDVVDALERHVLATRHMVGTKAFGFMSSAYERELKEIEEREA